MFPQAVLHLGFTVGHRPVSVQNLLVKLTVSILQGALIFVRNVDTFKMHRRINGVDLVDLFPGSEINAPDIPVITVAAIKYRIAAFVDVVVEFLKIFFRNTSEPQADEFKIQDGRQAAGKILERSDLIRFFLIDLHLFLEPVVFLIQPGQCLVNIFHTCDRLFQGKLFRFLPHIDREHCGIIIGQFQRVLIRIDL